MALPLSLGSLSNPRLASSGVFLADAEKDLKMWSWGGGRIDTKQLKLGKVYSSRDLMIFISSL